jgi:hypothetical protein
MKTITLPIDTLVHYIGLEYIRGYINATVPDDDEVINDPSPFRSDPDNEKWMDRVVAELEALSNEA